MTSNATYMLVFGIFLDVMMGVQSTPMPKNHKGPNTDKVKFAMELLEKLVETACENVEMLDGMYIKMNQIFEVLNVY